MSYHNHRVCFRLTFKEAEMVGTLIKRIRTKNTTGLMRLALGVLSRLARDDVPVDEQSDCLETWSSRQFVTNILERVRQQDLACQELAKSGGHVSDNSSSKRQTKSTSKTASAAPTS